MARTTARVEESTLVIGTNDTNPITVGSDAWFAWLETATAFLFTSAAGRFTARKERRDRGSWYWKAYRTDQGVLRRAYLGKSPDLTLDQLNRAAASLTKAATPVDPPPTQAVELPPNLATATDRPADFSLANLLATKLFVPPARANLVARPRLFERLAVGLRDKLTLIAAPAGFGKTTLLSAWRATEVGGAWPFAWVALDSTDNDPLRFWRYVIAALDTLAPGIGAPALTLLQSPQPPPMERILTNVLNAFSASAQEHDMALALDDYHVITTPAIHAALAWLLDYLPPNLHLVILTRADPALPLARLRARGAMTELHANDLRFTADEAATFLNQVMGLALTADVAALEARTEGWIAGLQLAALAMRGHRDRSRFIRTFSGSNRYIVDYLAAEVLASQPAHLQTFLLHTAFLDRMCGALCDAVLGQALPDLSLVTDNPGASHLGSSQRLLEDLERANLFVVPLDDERRWYRYHQLFADVLQARLVEAQPQQLAVLQRRASDWYEQRGLRGEAIRYALAAQDFAHAAGLIELAWPAMDGQFQSATWLSWTRALPAALASTRPVLNVAYAWALLNRGELEAAEVHLREAEQWLTSKDGNLEPLPGAIIVDETQLRTLPASLATARAYQAQARGDLPGAVQYGRRALDLLPPADHLRRGPAAALLGVAHWANGELEAAHGALAEAMANFQQVGSLHFAISGTYGLADIRTAQGRLRAAIKTYADTLQFALAQGEPPLRGTADLYVGLSELYREQGDLDAAAQHLRRSAELGESVALPDWRYRFCRAQARLWETQGDLAGALERLNEAERYYRRKAVPDLRPLPAMKARVWIAQGQLDEALRWVQTAGLTVDDRLSYLREFEHITLVRVLIAQAQHEGDNGRLHAAQGLLARLLPAAEAGGRLGVVIEILVLQALAQAAQSNLSAACQTLARALALAEPEGYMRIFVDEGAPMLPILYAVATSGIAPDYLARLLAAFSATLTAERGTPNVAAAKLPLSVPASPLIESLTSRELEVLRLIAVGKSNAEIAQTLVIALSTVKSHINTIFGKLQVISRTQALARAQALQLL